MKERDRKEAVACRGLESQSGGLERGLSWRVRRRENPGTQKELRE